MKKIFSLIFFSFFCFYVCADEEFTPEEQVIKTLELTRQNHQMAWPNLDLNDSPIVLTFSSGEIYAIHLKAPRTKWKSNQLLGETVHFAREDVWKVTQLKLHPSFDIDGENVFVFQMGNDEETLRIFAHERFHRYQLRYFAQEEKPLGEYSDHFNPENLALMKIEDAILEKFLKAPKQERLDLLKNYLSVYKERKKQISENSIHWEDHQQKMEGLADYVSAKMFDGESQILANIKALGEDADFSDYAIKWRHYSVGATLAFALDFLEVKLWKERVEKGSFLSEILEESLSGMAQGRLEQVLASYHYSELKETMSLKVKEYHEQMRGLFDRYQAIKGPILRLGHPQGIGISGGGTTQRLLSLADGTTLSLNDESFSSTTDSQWEFETLEVPFLIQNRAGFRELKVGNQCCLTLNNEKFSLEDLMQAPPGEYPFSTIALEGDHFKFSSKKHRGALVCDGNTLFIRYF